MSNVFQSTPSTSTSLNSAMGTTAQTAAVQQKINPGTPVQLVAIGNTQLQINSQKGSVTLPLPKQKVPIQTSQPFVAQLKTGPDTTLLEISHRFQQQQISLTATQTQQVVNQIAREPIYRESNIPLKAKVVAVQNNQIQLNVAGTSISIPVPKASEFKIGQWVSLDLIAKQNTATVTPDKLTTSTVKIDTKVASELINSALKTGKVIQINEALTKDKPEIAIIMKQVGTLEHSRVDRPIQLSQQGQRTSFSVPLSPAPILRIEVPRQQSEAVNQLNIKTIVLDVLKTQTAPETKTVQINQDTTPRGSERQQVSTSSENIAKAITTEKPQVFEKPIPTEKPPVFEKPIINKFVEPRSSDNRTTTFEKPVFTDKPPNIEKTITPKQDAPNLSDKTNSDNRVLRTPITQLGEPVAITGKPIEASPRDNKPGDAAQQPINKLIRHYQAQLGKEQAQHITQLLNKLNDVADSFNRSPPPSLNELSQVVQQLSQRVTESNGSIIKLQGQLQLLNKELQSFKLPPEIKTAISEVIAKVAPQPDRIVNIDATQVKQLLQASALPVSTQAISSITTQNGFVAGLVNLLQISMASRQQRSQSKTIDNFIQSIIPAVANAVGEKKSESTSKNTKDLAKIEQKYSLMKLSKESLEELSQSKLKNIERRLQGQEAMHFVIPFSGHQEKPIAEMLIKRQLEEEQQQEKEKQQHQIWHLTMKLQIGALGDILTKSTLTGQALDVEFFTSNNQLKDLVYNFVPLLKKRFDSLGIEMSMRRCEVGEIPESLETRPYQLFQAKV